MKIRPLHDRVIVKRIEEERKSAGGSVIPVTDAEKPDPGEIVPIGRGKKSKTAKQLSIHGTVASVLRFGTHTD